MIGQNKTRKFVSYAAFGAAILGLGVGQALLQHKAEAQGSSVSAPVFEVDPFWPKPLPNNWLLGWTIGVWADEQDYVWVIHRGAGGLHNNERGAELESPIAVWCGPEQPIMVFAPAGNVGGHVSRRDQLYDRPRADQGMRVDYKGKV